MGRLEQLNARIVAMLKDALKQAGSAAKVVAEDVNAPIKRPSAKVELDTTSTGRRMEFGQDRSATFRLYFFAADGDRPKMENLRVREAIEDVFSGGIQLDDLYIGLEEDVECEVTDGVLVATVVCPWAEPRDTGEDKAELMTNLVIDGEMAVEGT